MEEEEGIWECQLVIFLECTHYDSGSNADLDENHNGTKNDIHGSEPVFLFVLILFHEGTYSLEVGKHTGKTHNDGYDDECNCKDAGNTSIHFQGLDLGHMIKQ